MQSLPIQLRTCGNEVVQRSKDEFHRLVQTADPGFGSRFVTNSRLPRPMSALLSLSMRDEETLKAYLDKY